MANSDATTPGPDRSRNGPSASPEPRPPAAAPEAPPRFGPDWRPRFLTALRNGGNVRAASEAAGINRTTAYAARKREPELAAAWDAAMEDAIDMLELTARKRALAESDYLLLALLRAYRPTRYRETSRVQHEFSRMTDDELIREATEGLGGALPPPEGGEPADG